MVDSAPRVMICTCEKTMPLDAQAIGCACTGRITQTNHLCGADMDRFKAALADGAPITVACTQEAPLFQDVAESLASSSALTFVNIRETAGWSKDASAAGPKAAALIAAATEETPPILRGTPRAAPAAASPEQAGPARQIARPVAAHRHQASDAGDGAQI